MYLIKTLFSIDFDKEKVYIGSYPIAFNKIQNLLGGIVHIILILILMAISVKIGNYLIIKFVKRQSMSRRGFALDEKKANTIGEVLKSVLKYSVYFFGIAAILANVFTGMSLTLASIGGVALGFGAQSLVKDLINGFFVLFEDQYAVGDYITLGNFSGIVQSIGIRTTILKDFSGDIHLIPNGTITQVTNHSRGDMRVMVEVSIAYEEDIDNAIRVINNACEKVSEINDTITKKPVALGVDALGDSAIIIKVMGEAKSMSQWEVERALRREIKIALDREGIEIPYPKTQIINNEEVKD